ncbi:SDR family oxidoreductase [Pseudonocardia asaccharolytica]|uniref:NmrA family transcriptional regulator n=1 Tax=Pseudonocardia asaccharolytica DSM 44247 = NBRC 16224 TaxID=1123024 RepID=A0A511D081_9PSEU|nr:NAD(P)H-binding protein [Pseudonocardia asaccharolytica]GEL18186.1 NmrA family transcriptional regulator [Pseudonocardia asaccharolytica DSM 44247 = NBRC 16224]
MTAPLLVTGGTGTLGRLVVPLLREAGCTVRVLSRRSHEPGDGIEFVTGDLATGEGLDAAMHGVERIVHLAGNAKGDEDKARKLVRAASQAGARHLVYISVVGAGRIPVVSGVDRAMFGYFASKRAAEQAIADSGLPWTTLRATQFHELMLMVARSLAKLPVIPVPAGFRVQPVDAAEVAARLVELALGTPSGLVPDIAGPRVYGAAELLREYLRASHRHRPILPVRLPGKAAGAFRAGANLEPERAVGHRTWEDFLAERLSSGHRAVAVGS